MFAVIATALMPLLHAGEYPVIVNNYRPLEAYEDGGPEVDYILFRNQLISIDDDSIFKFDPSIPDSEFPDFPACLTYTYYNGTPHNFLVGTYDATANTFTYRSAKYVSPWLDQTGRNQWFISSIRNSKPEVQFGLVNVLEYREYPDEVTGANRMSRNKWETKEARFHFKLDPPLPIAFVTDTGDEQDPLGPNEKLVQGLYELGGAIVCGRKDDNVLTLYRLSSAQNTYPEAIQVFNPNEKLTWDTQKSDTKALAGLLHLRPDLLEHNTGLTENRLYVRMKPYTVKLDKPGETKALRDWYLLAPFYDPVTQSYRETLTREDFVAGDGFDPAATDFNPSDYLKKLVPYTLPAGFWSAPPPEE